MPFSDFLHSAAKALVLPIVGLLHFAGYYNIQPAYTPRPIVYVPIEQSLQDDHPLGGSNPIPTSVALFSTSLQSAITSSQTTMTLVSATYNNGASTLASSTYDFIIDEGTAQQEFVSADCTGTVCTNIQRGLDFMNGTTTVASLQFSHRRGATVKITDGPVLLKLNSLAAGKAGYPSPLFYTSAVATSGLQANSQNFATVNYVNSAAFNGAGVVNATAGASGVVQLATAVQTASSTSVGSSGASLVLTSGNSTSTFNTATAALKLVVTGNNGKIDPNFFPSSGLLPGLTTTLASSTFATTSLNIGAFNAYWIGKNIQVFSNTGTSTFTVPNGITKVWVRMVGGGGGGGAGGANNNGAGGGAGGYVEKMLDITGTSSIIVFVGNGGTAGAGAGANGTWSTFGSNGFYLIAPPGLGATNGTSQSGAAGGTPTTGDVNIAGGSGCGSLGVSGISGSGMCGGSSVFGSYPASGSGGPGGGPSANGNTGSVGYIIVTW